MSAVLRIHHERVAELSSALDRALEELVGFRFDDSAAGDAGIDVRTAVARFESWPRRLMRVVLCDALLRLGGVGALPDGMSLVPDEFVALTADEWALIGQAAAERVRSLRGASLTDGSLTEALEPLRGHPEAAAAFLTALGPDGAGRVFDLLSGLIRKNPDLALHPSPEQSAALTALDGLGAGLAVISHRATGGLDAWSVSVSRADPYVAARLVAAALPTGDPAVFAALAAGALHDLFMPAAAAEPLWRDGAAHLLDGLATSPAAARLVIEQLTALDLATLLLSVEPHLAGQMLIASADPRRTDADDVEASMSRVVDVLGTHQPGLDALSYAAPVRWPPSDDDPDARLYWAPGARPLFDRAPVGLGEYLAPYLPNLLAPPGLAGWEPVGYRSWDVTGRDDHLARTITIAMSDDASALALRNAARVQLISSIGIEGDTSGAGPKHAAYVIGALEDAAGTARYQSIDRMNAERAFELQLLETAISIPTGGLLARLGAPAVVESLAGLGVDQLPGAFVDDHTELRDVMAAETTRIEVAANAAGLSALAVFVTGRGITTALPAPLNATSFGDTEVGSRGDGPEVRAKTDEIDAWIEDSGLNEQEMDDARALYNDVRNGVREGAFTA